MRQSVIDQDILQEGELKVILRQLTRRFGELDPLLSERIRGLSVEKLEALADALLDFAQVTDLMGWLEQ